MKKILLFILLFLPHYNNPTGEDLHRTLEMKAKISQKQIQEAIKQIEGKIESKICENEEDRLDSVFHFINQWKTNHFNIYHPTVLQQSSTDQSYLHAVKNIMYITSILGLDNLNNMYNQSEHLVSQKTFDQFSDQHQNTDIQVIVIAPSHKKISTQHRCLVTLYDLSSEKTVAVIQNIKKNEHCCGGFIIKEDKQHFAVVVYKTEGSIYYIIADSNNEMRFENQQIKSLINALESKE